MALGYRTGRGVGRRKERLRSADSPIYAMLGKEYRPEGLNVSVSEGQERRGGLGRMHPICTYPEERVAPNLSVFWVIKSHTGMGSGALILKSDASASEASASAHTSGTTHAPALSQQNKHRANCFGSQNPASWRAVGRWAGALPAGARPSHALQGGALRPPRSGSSQMVSEPRQPYQGVLVWAESQQAAWVSRREAEAITSFHPGSLLTPSHLLLAFWLLFKAQLPAGSNLPHHCWTHTDMYARPPFSLLSYALMGSLLHSKMKILKWKWKYLKWKWNFFFHNSFLEIFRTQSMTQKSAEIFSLPREIIFIANIISTSLALTQSLPGYLTCS